jgi:glycosyltransferase involved in cell wall biosynthesis
LYLEALTAQLADHVFTLTSPMCEELIARGVQPNHISLLPNSCDLSGFEPTAKDTVLAQKLGIPDDVPVLGYIGSFTPYEGFALLARACAALKREGHVFRLLMVGSENNSDGSTPAKNQFLEAVEETDIGDWVIMPGRIPHNEVCAYYSLMDICPFPRLPLPVCEMVSPIKPLEAFAMSKAVVASDVGGMREMMFHEHNALVFKKGDQQALAGALERLLSSPELRKKLGGQAREWVLAERTWEATAQKAATVIRRLMGEPAKEREWLNISAHSG